LPVLCHSLLGEWFCLMLQRDAGEQDKCQKNTDRCLCWGMLPSK
jgi:hypothetical protein